MRINKYDVMMWVCIAIILIVSLINYWYFGIYWGTAALISGAIGFFLAPEFYKTPDKIPKAKARNRNNH